MSDRVTAPERPELTPRHRSLFAVSFAGQLDEGELLSGTPIVTEQTTSDLTISNVAVNTTVLTISNKSVAIGQAVQCFVIGQKVANSPYELSVIATTDSTPAQTKEGYGVFTVVR